MTNKEIRAIAAEVARLMEAKMRPAPVLMNSTEAAKYLNITPRALSMRVQRGLPAHRSPNGGPLHFDKNEIDAYYLNPER